MKITKYNISNPLDLVVPNTKRKWMDETHNAFAYRCLPLTIANGFGWTVINPREFSVIWNGNNSVDDIIIKHNKTEHIVSSHFGYSVITFSLGFMMQTESGHNLYVKGPANNPKRGISALEGIVETDWLPFTFTMNWKITEPNYEITFHEGEPICSMFPFQRGYLEQWNPEIKNIKDNEELNIQYTEWSESRRNYNSNLKTNGNKGERDYLRGQHKNGEKFKDHQNSIRAKEFAMQNKDGIMFDYCYDNCCMEMP